MTFARGAAALAVAVACVAAIPVARAEVIEPDSVAGQNIQVAASFVRANGNPKLANNILEFLAKGYFSRESMTGKVGNTSAFNNIDLDPSVVTPAAGNSIKGQPHYVVQLAAVLTHEKRHAHQHVWDKIGESFKEFDAWTTEIIEEDNWIQSLNKKYHETNDPADLAMLKEATDTKAETLREFIEDQNCFGYGCDVWKKLREAILALRKVYPEKAPKSEDKRVGMLIDKARNTELVALIPRAMPPGGCWVDGAGHLVPPNSYTPEGSRLADAFDPRVAIGGGAKLHAFSRWALDRPRWRPTDGGGPGVASRRRVRFSRRPQSRQHRPHSFQPRRLPRAGYDQDRSSQPVAGCRDRHRRAPRTARSRRGPRPSADARWEAGNRQTGRTRPPTQR